MKYLKCATVGLPQGYPHRCLGRYRPSAYEFKNIA